MIIRNEQNRVTGIRVILDGQTYTVNQYSFVGGMGIPVKAYYMAAGEAFHDPEAREFLKEITQGVRRS